MGAIKIEMKGSFTRNGSFEASAQEGGHAFAIHRSIQYLLNELPAAIRKDHKQHAAGHTPPVSEFGRMPDPVLKDDGL